jgi:cytochrome c oxidase subunit 3
VASETHAPPATPVPADVHPPAHPVPATAVHGHGDNGHHGHGPLQHQFDDLEQQRDCYTLGMWLFLITEVMMFGGLFFAYALYRWKYDGAFHEGARHLDVTMGTINTFVLLVSSLTMALAVHGAAEKRKWPSAGWLTVTWLLGATFLVVKAFEWTHDYHIGLIPGVRWDYYDRPEHAAELARLAEMSLGPHHVKLFFTVYFCMTGLHAIHMIVGLLMVGYFIFLTLKGHFLGGNDQPVEILGLYWHLVDIVWVFLFPLLYLIHGFHPFSGGAH